MRRVVCEQKLRPNIPNRWQSCEVGRVSLTGSYHPLTYPHQDQWAQFIQCYHPHRCECCHHSVRRWLYQEYLHATTVLSKSILVFCLFVKDTCLIFQRYTKIIKVTWEQFWTDKRAKLSYLALYEQKVYGSVRYRNQAVNHWLRLDHHMFDGCYDDLFMKCCYFEHVIVCKASNKFNFLSDLGRICSKILRDHPVVFGKRETSLGVV